MRVGVGPHARKEEIQMRQPLADMRRPDTDERQAVFFWSLLALLGVLLSVVGWVRWAG